MSSYMLAIDFGTTFSVGVVMERGGTPEVLELDNSRYLSSLVLLDKDGAWVVGRSAVRQEVLYPDRVCQAPKRAVGKQQIVLGGQPVFVHDAIGAVLARLGGEAARRFDGASPQRVILTHPATWADERLAVLREACDAAGLGADPVFVAEPVAAAAHYADGSLAEGAHVAVYDLGGGTFDVAVLRRSGGGFDVVGRPGGDAELGGEDFDEALSGLLERHGAEIDADGYDAARAAGPASREWITFRREVRETKHALSEENACSIGVPGVGDAVHVTRRELEQLLEPHVRHTIDLLAATIAEAGLTPADLTALYLTGGSSRIPLVSTLITQHLGITPITKNDPKAIVAIGAIQAAIQHVPVEGGDASSERSSTSARSSTAAEAPPPEPTPAALAPDDIVLKAEKLAQYGNGFCYGTLTLTTRRLTFKTVGASAAKLDVPLEQIARLDKHGVRKFRITTADMQVHVLGVDAFGRSDWLKVLRHAAPTL